jgi:uncharacterized protein YbbK (DUF523 family)
MSRKVALSACLMGCECRYDGDDNLNKTLLNLLEDYDIIPFCPEDYCFGTPRPTMDLIQNETSTLAISNETSKDLSQAIIKYAETFFENNPQITLFIGKDRSPSCGVQSARVYNEKKELLHSSGIGLMAKVAQELGIECYDAEVYLSKYALEQSIKTQKI